jgi:hypothetical protein
MRTKKAIAAAAAGLVFGISSAAVAQTPAANSAQKAAAASQKSVSATTLGDGEAIMIGPRGQRVFKSNTKVSDASVKSAATRAKEIPLGTVIYKEGGKLYMLPNKEQAAQTFQNQFDMDY